MPTELRGYEQTITKSALAVCSARRTIGSAIDPSLVLVFQALPGASFIVNGATPAKNSAFTSAGVALLAHQRRVCAVQV